MFGNINKAQALVDRSEYKSNCGWPNSRICLQLQSHVKKIMTSKIKILQKICRYIGIPRALAICKQMILPLFDNSGFL